MKKVKLFEEWIFGNKKTLVPFYVSLESTDDYELVSMEDIEDDYDRYRIGDKILHFVNDGEDMVVRYHNGSDNFVIINYTKDGIKTTGRPSITKEGIKIMKEYIMKNS